MLELCPADYPVPPIPPRPVPPPPPSVLGKSVRKASEANSSESFPLVDDISLQSWRRKNTIDNCSLSENDPTDNEFCVETKL